MTLIYQPLAKPFSTRPFLFTALTFVLAALTLRQTLCSRMEEAYALPWLASCHQFLRLLRHCLSQDLLAPSTFDSSFYFLPRVKHCFCYFFAKFSFDRKGCKLAFQEPHLLRWSLIRFRRCTCTKSQQPQSRDSKHSNVQMT